ncbi:tRNA delta(2)-isopentenylpyrophosphate transferase [Candidatus Liberibacter solanacearum]|uniref:tRNA dimethylallyltransferase n=1 Tax=Candidatus Liberibacter solanacearum TaxID=556287 RepID=A0A094Z0G0_9HYPH|nr:tRNA (adenosine(37)-N6)-dimethylallyltransferase MiaA [Candidatus Liberibacter solanacearum]KGB27705.1 tRNA delta(2)-isopentenylpyrophosphate transferase [Candidatus Liberibacter solanacearum]KJZ81275.1 tRNA delta(2)-isopentenylpyrophosphate transferase [Candidatus Liberibacter solanacearum]KJZ82660.1 tRNA delta(2)-isopentenylpyrophosphate transferase [Candidatus Liberibacter solanacearum]KQC49140.1 tRNA dimethylallyltransferase [Candidatus Liberibacter solanacearum]
MMMFLSTDTKAILIAGPTASGKSMCALKLAQKLNGAIINADSMQVYDTLKILTSRPSDQDMQSIPHYLYGHVSAQQTYSTGKWLRCAIKKITEVQKNGHLPIIVGGTGLYFRALTGQFSVMPEIPMSIRKNVREKLEKYGPHVLHDELSQIDPCAAQKIHLSDGQRIARALEIKMVSGQSITEFWKKSSNPIIPIESSYKIVILPERSYLKDKISQRFKRMLDSGAIDEIRSLMKMNLSLDLPIMKAIGVWDIMALLKGEINYEETLLRGIIATNQYAKKQITWFCHQLNEDWKKITSADDLL